MIYMDNAATTMHKPECVIDAVAGKCIPWGMREEERMRHR